MIEKTVGEAKVRLIRGDITLLDVDAFVLHARKDLALRTGFGGAVVARGGPTVQEELKKLGPLEVGQVAVSGAGNLTARHIIHAVAPGFQEEGEERKLAETVRNVLKRAEEIGIQRLAFPPLGSGFYGIPLDVSARVMVGVVEEHLAGRTGLKEVVFCVADGREYGPFAARLNGSQAGGAR